MKQAIHGLSFWIFLSTLMLLLGGCDDSPQRLQLTGKAIGTTYSVILYPNATGLSQSDLEDGINDVVTHVNNAMSLFNPDSDLSRFNQYSENDWFPVSEELVAVVAKAIKIGETTHGAFDITVSPLVNLWGFGYDQQPTIIPTATEIRNAQKTVGHDLLEFRTSPPALRKRKASVSIDLGAIAKGFCVDAVARWLDAQGISNYLVEIGGEIQTRGTKPQSQAWNIAVEKPLTTKRAIQMVLSLKNTAMATSGDYRNYFEINHKRYSHIIVPSTGYPITHKLASVSVLSSTCMQADALATALMVLGPLEGVALAQKHHWDTLFIVKTQDGFKEIRTGNFPSPTTHS